jgi:site-specific recombinase XerD
MLPDAVRTVPAWAAPAPDSLPGAVLDRIAPAASDAVREVLGRVHGAIRARHYSRRTEKAYLGWIRRFISVNRGRDPAALGAPEVGQFLSMLAVRGHVAASTQNQAFSALLFLYRDVLERDLAGLDETVRAKRPVRLPQVLTPAEVQAVLGHLRGTVLMMASLLYGSGLRVLECAASA